MHGDGSCKLEEYPCTTLKWLFPYSWKPERTLETKYNRDSCLINIAVAEKSKKTRYLHTRNCWQAICFVPKTWRVTQALLNKLQTLTSSCLCNILCICWPEKINNEDLWRTANQSDFTEQRAVALSTPSGSLLAALRGRLWPGIHSRRERGDDPETHHADTLMQNAEKWSPLDGAVEDSQEV